MSERKYKSSIGNRIYPLRVIGYLLAVICIVVFKAYVNIDFSTNGYVLIVLFVLYPHVAFAIYRWKNQSKQVEMVNLALDMFWIACISYLLHFAPIVFFPFVITNSATNFSLGGIRLFLWGILCFFIGIAFCALIEWGIPELITDAPTYALIPSYFYLFLGVHYIGFLSYSLGTSARSRKKKITAQNETLQEQANELMTLNEEINQQNEEISSQRDNIQKQHLLLAEKTLHVTKSINYAKRIQDAVLPNQKDLATFFTDYFVFFKPKDIVSGDFYWIKSLKENCLLLAVADCTGHGVPGAFMSLISQSLLNELSLSYPEAKPAHLLELLKVRLGEVLHQDTSNNQDGLEIALCLFERQSDTLNVTYAGAGIPLIKVGKENLEIIKGSKVYIGGLNKQTQNTIQENHISIDRGESIYLFSDGCPDQFGGESNKKFSRKRLYELLEDNHVIAADKKLEHIKSTFQDWMKSGKEQQTDDMIMIGLMY